MSSTMRFREGQKYVYKLEILRVFKAQTWQERQDGVEKVRLDEPVLVELGWYDTPGSARNYGSYRTDRKEWYNNIGKITWEYVRVHNETKDVVTSFDNIPSDEWKNYTWEKRDIPQPVEPELDYRVYRVPVTLDMGEAVQLPALKKLYEVAE